MVDSITHSHRHQQLKLRFKLDQLDVKVQLVSLIINLKEGFREQKTATQALLL